MKHFSKNKVAIVSILLGMFMLVSGSTTQAKRVAAPPNELVKAAVKVVEKYPTRSFASKTYELLYVMKASSTKTALMEKMASIVVRVDAEEMVRAQQGVQMADASPEVASYNVAIHRIERVRSDECQKGLRELLSASVAKKYGEIFAFPKDFASSYPKPREDAVARAESYKIEPYLTEGDEAAKTLPYGSERSALEARMRVAHKEIDSARIQKALKSVDLAAISDDMSLVVVAMDSIDQIGDLEARNWLEQRLFQFKVRSMSRTDLSPYLPKLKVPASVVTVDMTAGNALNWVILAEVHPTAIYIKKAEVMVNELGISVEKDLLMGRIEHLK